MVQRPGPICARPKNANALSGDGVSRALGRRRLAFAVSRNADYGSSLNAIVPFYGNRSFQIPSEHLVVKGLGSKVFFCLTDRT